LRRVGLKIQGDFIIKLRDTVFLVIGGFLVISGMVLNTLISGDAEAQGGGDNTFLKNVFCENLVIQDKNGRWRGLFGLSSNRNAILNIYGDDGKTPVAYLGGNPEQNDEMMFQLQSKSKTYEGSVLIKITEYGGSAGFFNNMGKHVAVIGVSEIGSGVVGTRDKFGYKK
jgi:hypothetical protein